MEEVEDEPLFSRCRRAPGTATPKVTLTGNDARGRFHAQKEQRPTLLPKADRQLWCGRGAADLGWA
jgi:hypothetical protein